MFRIFMAVVCLVPFLSGITYIAFVGFTNPVPEGHFPKGTSYNFGIIDEGESVTHKFILENSGKRDLEIIKISTGCGCTGAEASETTIEPGGTSEITVSYTGRLKNGAETLPVWIQSNDPQNPLFRLFLRGRVQPKVFYSPVSISFCYSQGDPTQYEKITFSHREGDTLQFDNIESTSQLLTVKETAKGNNSVEFLVAFNPPENGSNSTEYLTFLTSVDGKKKEIVILVFINYIWKT